MMTSRMRCGSACTSPLRKIKRVAVLGVFIFAAFKFSGYEFNSPITKQGITKTARAASRHLLSTVEWEQCDFEIGHKRNYSEPSTWYAPSSANGWVVLYCVLVLIVFVALAIICDDFFVPSLEAISEKLDLSEDVAGATFMAAGSSAPELFTSIAGVAVESDVGVGTIVGSAVFNLLGICALSAAFAGKVLHLDWRPLARDATFYGISICVFILFAWDGKFYIWESCILLLLYFLYILMMKFNPKLMEMMSRMGRTKKIAPKTKCATNSTNKKESQTETKEKDYSVEEGEDEEGEIKRRFSHINKGYLPKELTHGAEDNSQNHSKTTISSNNNDPPPSEPQQPLTTIPDTKFATPENNTNDSIEKAEKKADDDDDGDTTIVIFPCLPPVSMDVPNKPSGGCLSMLRFIFSWILFLVSFPFVVIFTWTIPNCSTPETKKNYMFSFIMSITWIAALSFGMVTLVGRAGCILGIDKFTMGLVVVAIGTSIPDALSSILVARDGFGDMAVSNAIGSNVFDIDLGLGLPFVISSLIRNFEPVKVLTAEEQAKYDSGEIVIIPHVKFGLILLVLLALSLTTFVLSKFKLNKYLGFTFVCMYFCFVGYAYVQDLHCDHNC